MSSTVGSPTSTCWNRRSRAGSFSTFCRNSSSVVAPTIRSSPRASIGLSMLPASIEPSALPAPTTVCISSMKVMIEPSDCLISSRTALSRSSNSPRYFEPAIIDPRSSATIRLCFRLSGTSPSTTRWASPSTTAVLPTPGSPMRTGLFLVRRARTCTTRRISVSRPITGSSSPRRARSVRSTPYFSSALYVPSGSWLVTRRTPPRTLAKASTSALGSACWPRSSVATSPPASARPTSRCSVETKSSPTSLALLCATASEAISVRLSWGAATLAPCALGRLRSSASARARTVDGVGADGRQQRAWRCPRSGRAGRAAGGRGRPRGGPRSRRAGRRRRPPPGSWWSVGRWRAGRPRVLLTGSGVLARSNARNPEPVPLNSCGRGSPA